MQNHFPQRALGWLTSWSFTLLVACGGDGDGGGSTAPPAGADDEAREDAAAERAAKASAEFEQQVASGNPDPVAALVASLQADPKLTDVERLDDGAAVLATLNGVPFGVLVADQTRAQWIEVGAGATPSAVPGSASKAGASVSGLAARSGINCDAANYPRSKKACVLRQLEFSAFPGDSVEHSLQRAGFEIVQLSWPVRAQEIVQLHQALGSCGVLYILAHGAVKKNLAGQLGNVLYTDIAVPNRDNREVLGAAFGANAKRFFGRGSHAGKTYLTIAPHFFESATYPNTFVFINSCSGDRDVPDGAIEAGGRQLRDAFLERGAGIFLGWKRPIPIAVGIPAAREIFKALAPAAEVADVNGVTLAVDPPNPDPGQSYEPSAKISPARSGVEISLRVRGSDQFARDTTAITDLIGEVTFASVPGGEGQVTDTITVAVGGADDAQTARDAVLSSPTLQKRYSLWGAAPTTGASTLGLSPPKGRENFNLVCNNSNLTETQTLVKF